MYFKDFPNFLYDFKFDGTDRTIYVKDITRNIRFRKEILSNITAYDEYDVLDGETPEIIAEKIYGNPNYHWIIMLANDKYDWLTDFPLLEPELNKVIATRYNPVLYSSKWWYEGNKIYVTFDNNERPFNIDYLPSPVFGTVTGAVCDTNPPNGYYQAAGIYDENTVFYYADAVPTGTPSGYLTIRSEGRENNPVYFINSDGFRINPSPEAIPVTGIEEARAENDKKRRIKVISPSLVSTILRNFKELL